VEVSQYPDEEAWIPGGHGCFGPVSVCYRGLLTLGAGDDVARRQRSTRTRVRTEREASASVTRAETLEFGTMPNITRTAFGGSICKGFLFIHLIDDLKHAGLSRLSIFIVSS